VLTIEAGLKKKLTTSLLGLSLLASVATYTESVALDISFINIDLSGTANPTDFPIGIECGDADFVYVTVFIQGLVAKINKDTRLVEELIDDPDSAIVGGVQNFFDITRDPNTGHLFINERDNAKIWRFDPSAPPELAWTRIPIIERVTDPNGIATYPQGFDVNPTFIRFDIDGDGQTDESVSFGAGNFESGIEFVNGNVWAGFDYRVDFSNAVNNAGVPDLPASEMGIPFVGLVKIDPITLNVSRIQLFHDGARSIAGLVADADSPSIMWLTDKSDGQVFKFDTVTETIIETISIGSESHPLGIATDSTNVYVALRGQPGGNSTIAQINKNTLALTLIDTGAPITHLGTFTVFVNGGVLVWTDGSSHVGTIDLTTGEKTVQSTGDVRSNHFGCVPLDGEFWFAGQGSAKVGILPNSKFIGGRPVRATSTGGGGAGMFRSRDFAFGNPDDPRYDGVAPVIKDVLTQEGSLKILAEITDTVGVKDVSIIISKKAFPMSRHAGSQSWWYYAFTSEDLSTSGDTLLAKLVARDYNDNTSEHSVSLEIPLETLSPSVKEGASFAISSATVVSQEDHAYSIVTTAIGPSDQSISPQITIKNTGTEPLQNIRVMLSPSLKGKFLLSDYAIKRIEPKSEVIVTVKLNGKPNLDAMKNPIPYQGQVIISIDNGGPHILELSGAIPNESASMQSLFMKMVENKGEQRYKSFEKPDLRISQEADYKVTLGSGENLVRGSDELIITNTSDRPLKNLRIMTSSVSDFIMPDQKNIDFLPAGSFVKVKLVSKLNDAVPRDLRGEIIVAPENGNPLSVPISVGKQPLEDKNRMYQVRTESGSSAITHTSESIVIANTSSEPINNVRIILPQQLARIFSLSQNSFKTIESDSEKIVYMKQRGTFESNVKQILNDYSGDIIIVSSDGMKKVIPVSIVWKGIVSEHFVVNARNSAEELSKASQIINFLERSYSKTAEILGETDGRTAIYMTSSLDEVKMLSNALAPSAYIYNEDIALIWSESDDVNTLALKQFAHRIIMQNLGTYWVKQKVTADQGNWLVDGISTYVVAKIVGERDLIMDQLTSFIEQPVSFVWYGESTSSHHGASYTLLKFLSEKYGDAAIDRILNNLHSTMVSNHECRTFEQCAVVRAVHDIQGFNLNDRRHELTFDTLVNEWKDYVQERYAISEKQLENINSLN
jgi:DNA-binding beta-propeller fold protein YncE